MSARLPIVLLFVVLFALTLNAQTFRGSLQGTITDSSGAAVPGAEVKILHTGTGFVRTLATNSDGEFSATELPLGAYTVTVTKQGFRTQNVKNVSVEISSAQRVNVMLSPGEVQETVNVNADLPLIETVSNTMGGTISGPEASEMPVNGRDFTKLLVLVPGATGDPVGSSDSPGSFGLFSVNGNRGRSNNYLLDGTDMNDGYRNLPSINEGGVFGTPATVLPIDALAEVPVISGGEAEYGRNSGAIVNLVTKSGTNNIHGTLYGFLRDDRFDARNFFNTAGSPQNKFHNDQFGISAGGPVIKDRTFWFAAYEGQREHGSLPSEGTVPSQADIVANTPVGGINPVIQNILNLNPWGTLPATGNTVQYGIPFSNRVDSLILKLDQHLGPQDRHDLLTGRYFFGDSNQSFPLALVGAGSAAPGFNTVTPTRVNVLSLSYAKILTPALLLEFRFGYNRFHETFSPQDSNLDPGSLGLNTLPAGATSRDFGLPIINVGDFSSLGANLSTPRGRTDVNWQYFNNASWTKGSHNYKFGYEFRRTTVDGFFDAGFRGRLDFDTLADFLNGDPSGGRSASGSTNRKTYENSNGLYIQDSWRITPRFTFNWGLRWDYYGVIGEEDNKLSLLDNSGTLRFVGQPGGPSELYPKDWNNFGPRLSFAYDFFGTGKTVIRAGWGLFYDAFSQDFFAGQLPWPTFNAGPAYNDVLFAFGSSVTSHITPGPAKVYDPAEYSASDVFTVDQRLRTPYVQNYNLNFEQQLGGHMALQVGYVGSAGRKLFRYLDINQADAAGNHLFPGLVYVLQFQSSSASSYNSLQTSLRMRNWHGLTSTFNYTWAHSIDDASDGQDYVPNASQPDDSFNPGRERASSNFDTRHRVQWFWTYEFPNSATMPKLTDGWMINGVTTYSTGQPYNLSMLFPSFGPVTGGDYNGTGEFYGRPDVIGNPFAGTGGPSALLNLSAFAAPCTWVGDIDTGDCDLASRHIGNLGRNAFRGPNYANFDFSLAKNTKLGERLNMQIRMDFFNIFNHPNFTNPLLPNFATDMFTNGGQVVNGRLVGTGFLASTATPDVGTGNPYLGGGGPRNIQFGLKFSF
jgi:outer membrane receptor protein involved in Fe transport